MKWLIPRRVKVFEALGCIADGRIELSSNEAKVFSSSRGKFYTVILDFEKKVIMSNDNVSYWAGALGYPSIALLMFKKILPFDERLASALKGIPWKDINQKYKNDFSKTELEVFGVAQEKGVTQEELEEFGELVLKKIKELGLEYLGSKITPPQGY
ncbi:MAG: hypothetical protein NTY48_02085 [Candidatus Diapherotrites archaeon]|nr:hypothetical protein [Candidatus Woesebacteria bacterium]MCX6803340.1 hypothetical protein [Candidatus Diapherotrites archaeon]